MYLSTHAGWLHSRLHARLYVGLNPGLHAWTQGRVSSRCIFHLHALSGLVHKLSDQTK